MQIYQLSYVNVPMGYYTTRYRAEEEMHKLIQHLEGNPNFYEIKTVNVID